MKQFLFSVLVVCFFANIPPVSAQKEYFNWINPGVGLISFNNDSLKPELSKNYKMPYGEGVASISDGAGNLLFYGSSHELINKEQFQLFNGYFNTWSKTTQDIAIIPYPLNQNQYYVFTIDRLYIQPRNSAPGVLIKEKYSKLNRYHIVDMRGDNGKGSVIYKDKLLDSLYPTKMSIGKDFFSDYYWVIIHELDTNKFYSYRVTEFGIDKPKISQAGPNHSVIPKKNIDPWDRGFIGCSKVSPLGDKLAYANSEFYTEVNKFPNDEGSWSIDTKGHFNGSRIEIYDFDSESGFISNSLILEDSLFNYVYGIEFSPDGSKLYITTAKSIYSDTIYGGYIIGYHWTSTCYTKGKIYQFDLTKGNSYEILSSAIEIADGSFSAMQLGPDGKIYINSDSSVAVINYPMKNGADCGFEKNGIYVPGLYPLFALPLGFYDFSNVLMSMETNKICEGDTIKFNYQHLIKKKKVLQYEWLGPNNLRKYTESLTILNASTKHDGWYRLQIIFDKGYRLTDSVYVKVEPKPSFKIVTDKGFKICKGDSLVLYPDPINPAFKYSWSTGETEPQITVSKGGKYVLTVENELGCSKTDSIAIEEVESPEVSIDAPGNGFCIGGDIKLTAITDCADCSFRWSTGAVNRSAIIVDEPGIYKVFVTNSNGCSDSAEIEIFRYDKLEPKVIGKRNFCHNEVTILRTDVNYQEIKWNTEEATSEITVTQAGKYWYWAMDDNGCEGWSDTVVVIEYPEVKVEIVGKSEICEGESTTLQTTEEYIAYKWNTGVETRALTVNQAGKYEVEVTDENGCKAKAEIEVKTIEIVISGNDDIDFGECKLKKECVVTKTIKNNSSKAIHINAISQSGDNAFSFSTTPILPATLQPNAELQLVVKFTPLEKRFYTALLTYEIDSPCTETVETVVRGTGVAISSKAIVWLPDTSAYVGEVDYCIPLYARLETDESVSDLSFSAVISFNANAMKTKIPNAGTIDNEERVITISGTISELNKTHTVLAEFCGDVLLAGKSLIPLQIEQFEWSEEIETEKHDGSLILQFCQQNLAAIRLVQQTQIALIPNPASDEININISSEEIGQFTLEIYSITGTLLEKRSWSSSGKQDTQLKLDLSNYATGMYQVVVSSPNGKKASQLRIMN